MYERQSLYETYEPAIVTALTSGNREVVEELLRRGEVLPSDSQVRAKIFFYLVKYDREELFTWLTQTQGWSFAPQEWNSLYDEAIVYALRIGDFQRLQRVIRMNYPVENIAQKEGFLIYAAHGGNLQAVKWLVSQGVPIQPNKAQHYYVYLERKYPELGIALFGGVHALNYKSIELQPTALEEAQARGHAEIAEWLIRKGAKPLSHLVKKESTPEQESPHIERENCRSIQCEIYNYQSMKAAAKIRRVPISTLDDQTSDHDGTSEALLVRAIRAEHLPLVQYILLRYPKKILEQAWDESLLHVAVKTQSTAMVKFLLERGADPFALDLYGRTPLDMSIDLRHQPIYNLLRNAEINAMASKKGGRH